MSNYLTFSVRTCDNAHLMLSAEMLDTTNAYEIVLGAFSNTKSDIRRGSHGPPLVQVDTPNIMKCDEYLPFWVRWENKTLQLGYGAIDETVLMRLDDAEMPAITAASVSSWESANGEYQFPETQGLVVSIFLVFLFHFLGVTFKGRSVLLTANRSASCATVVVCSE